MSTEKNKHKTSKFMFNVAVEEWKPQKQENASKRGKKCRPFCLLVPWRRTGLPFLVAAAAAAAAALSALDGGSSMLILDPASERVNFLGHSLVLAQLNTSYMELDMRLMSVRRVTIVMGFGVSPWVVSECKYP